MKLCNAPFQTTDWKTVPPVEQRGEVGASFSRTIDAGNVRTRLVDYSPGFKSDHWCGRGHVAIVLEGELIIRLRDGQEFRLMSGNGFIAGDDEANPHLAASEKGARVFIVD